MLTTIAEALNGAGKVHEALQATLEQVAALLGLDAGWIWLADARATACTSRGCVRRHSRRPPRPQSS